MFDLKEEVFNFPRKVNRWFSEEDIHKLIVYVEGLAQDINIDTDILWDSLLNAKTTVIGGERVYLTYSVYVSISRAIEKRNLDWEEYDIN